MLVQKTKFVLSVVLFGALTVILYYLNMPPVVTVFFRGSLGMLTVIIIMLAMGKKPELKAIKSNYSYCDSGDCSDRFCVLFLF